ncbi:MAG: nucleotidyltransferase domain-containing protein [Candidatus Omnitrophota bacterium]
MGLKNIQEEILRAIFRHLCREKCVVFLFGSFAKGKFSRGSDIDVGIICGAKITRAKVALIKNDIEEKVKTLRKVDLVDFYGITNNDFLKASLGRIAVWHETGKSKVFLSNLKKRIKN